MYKILIFSLLFMMFGCSQKYSSGVPLSSDIDYPLYMLGKELASGLDVKLNFEDIDHHSTLDEVTLIKEKYSLKIIINGHIFESDKAKPILSTKYIIEDVANSISNYINLSIQVYGHSGKYGTISEKQDLSDNRSIAVAEILYKINSTNNILAKGCSDRKPLFSLDSQEHTISNGRVEIYIYIEDDKAKDHCR